MSETIELHERYPQSRREDITDAFMRGVERGLEIANAENARLGFVELPKDADGVPIRAGDVLEGTHGQRRSVDVLELHKSGRWTAGAYGEGYHLQQLDSWRVVKPLTPEDALRELVRDMWGVMWACADQRCAHRTDDCYRVLGNRGDVEGSGECWFEARMAQLGVEL